MTFKGGKIVFRTCLILWLVVALPTKVQSQSESQEYALKAAFIEKLCRFIDWSNDDSGADSSQFVIAVLGKNPFGDFLEKLAASQRIKGRTVKVAYYSNVSEIKGCNVIFIPGTEKSRLKQIIEYTKSQPVLLVADTEGFAKQGVHINFYQSGETLRFEINREAALDSGLRIRSRVLKHARIVYGEDQ